MEALTPKQPLQFHDLSLEITCMGEVTGRRDASLFQEIQNKQKNQQEH